MATSPPPRQEGYGFARFSPSGRRTARFHFCFSNRKPRFSSYSHPFLEQRFPPVKKMIPPKFSDIGKSASDLLTKDYPVGVAKLEVKTTTADGVTFSVNGNQDAKSGSIVADVKTKVTDKAKGR